MTTPIQTPITGTEQAQGGEPLAALIGFYRAFNARDLALMQANWDDAEDVSMDNPLGGILRGWSQLRPVYQRLFDGAARVTVEFHDYTVHHLGDVFVAVGRERGQLQRPDVTLDLAIRTTRLFRHVGQTWRQFHHHGSIDDPQLLAAYRDAVR